MRFLVCFVLVAFVALAAAVPANIEVKEVPESLYDVDVQGHENTGEREARQFYGGYGGFGGGYGGGYGGYPGGFGGGYRGGYGGYRGGYGGGYGGNRGGYGGHRGGHRGGYYG